MLIDSNLSIFYFQSPQQDNDVDCGLLMLENLEQFFTKNPITDFRIPINRRAWYNPAIAAKKRKDIADALIVLMSAQGGVPDLPVLSFNEFDEDVRLIEANCSRLDESNNNRREEHDNNRVEGAIDSKTLHQTRGANGAVPTSD